MPQGRAIEQLDIGGRTGCRRPWLEPGEEVSFNSFDENSGYSVRVKRSWVTIVGLNKLLDVPILFAEFFRRFTNAIAFMSVALNGVLVEVRCHIDVEVNALKPVINRLTHLLGQIHALATRLKLFGELVPEIILKGGFAH